MLMLIVSCLTIVYVGLVIIVYLKSKKRGGFDNLPFFKNMWYFLINPRLSWEATLRSLEFLIPRTSPKGCHGLNIKTPFFIEVGFCVYDICISIVVVNSACIGKVSAINYTPPSYKFIQPINATLWYISIWIDSQNYVNNVIIFM